MRNIADEIYYTLYTIIVTNLIPSLATVIVNMQAYFLQISILAIALLGLSMLYQKIDGLTFLKSLMVIFMTMSFFFAGTTGSLFLLNLLVDLFINLPIKIGSIIVSTMSSVLYGDLNKDGLITNTTIEIIPSSTGTTAFGKLWQISTDVANSVWATGGMSNIGAYFLGGALWVVAIFMLVAQMLVLGTSLLMSAIAIFLAPVFIPMLLFKSTRPMFQSWVGFGLGGGFGLLILMIMLGILFGFISVTFFQLFGVDLTTTNIDSMTDINHMGKLSGLLLFMIITIKLLPHASSFASSLAGASAAGISDGLTAVGGQFLKTMSRDAKNTLKRANENVLTPSVKTITRGIGKGVERIKSRNSKSKGSSSNTLKSKSEQNITKAVITQRLASRHAQKNKERPLSNLANRERRQNKIKALSHMPSNTAQQSKVTQPQAVAEGNSSRPIGASTKTAKGSHSSTSSKSTKEPGTKNPGQSPGPKEQKEVSRTVVANSSKASSSPKSSSKTSSQQQEPKNGADGKNTAQAPSDTKSVNREKVIEKKSQNTSSGASKKSENIPPAVQSVQTVHEKSVNRDKNLSKPSKAERVEQKQQINPGPKKEVEVRRREDSTIKKSKEKLQKEDEK